jgi:saccharopine dehydrogenase-like NADP-dependent oxidoreductase
MGQMAVCCQNLMPGTLISRSTLSVLVGTLFKKFGLFLNKPHTFSFRHNLKTENSWTRHDSLYEELAENKIPTYKGQQNVEKYKHTSVCMFKHSETFHYQQNTNGKPKCWTKKVKILF